MSATPGPTAGGSASGGRTARAERRDRLDRELRRMALLHRRAMVLGRRRLPMVLPATRSGLRAGLRAGL